MRKFTLLILLLFGQKTVFCQTAKFVDISPDRRALIKAKTMLDHRSKYYSPEQAFVVFRQLADKGNAEGMNGLANLYNNGQGTAVDESEALKWYVKAADAGYANAWFNVGNTYKMGIGVPVDFKKAYEAFGKGIALNNGPCFYGQGYLLYKGLGVTQNYPAASGLFRKGAQVNNVSSCYMLGLCFRNGYGVERNADSARVYLTKAAEHKDSRALAELKQITPENTDMVMAAVPQPPAIVARPIDPKSGFKKLNQKLPKELDLSGEYTGFVIKFDWSGQHILTQDVLRLKLEQKHKEITGIWEEEGQESVMLNAELTDTAVLFKHTEQQLRDHYHEKNKLLVNFKNSYLNLVQSSDTIYLSGNITMYAPKAKEPEKPRLIMLVRTNVAAFSNEALPTTAANQAEEERLDAETLHFLAYPNPFTTTTSFRYTLRRAATVNILITDVQTGRTVYRNQLGLQKTGDYTIPLTLNERPDNYVVTLQYNKKIKSLIVIKN
jgi:hypothetical protein